MLAKLLKRQNPMSVGVGGISWLDYQRLWEQFGFGGVTYMAPAGGMAQMAAEQGFRNPIVLACVVIRALAFSEIRFQFQYLTGNRTAQRLYGNPDLTILEKPWRQGYTRQLLTRMEVDVSRFGNSYWWRSGNGLVWLDPSRMIILTGDVQGPDDSEETPAGHELLAYQLLGKNGQSGPVFLPDEVAHYRPIPDPTHPFRGLSWLSSLLPDITADTDLSDFKHSFVRNAATPNIVVKFGPGISEDSMKNFTDRLEASHTGPQAGFKTLYLGPGADVQTIGSNWAEMELATTQSVGEVRLCASAGVPATIVGIAEGLKGSALNAGNYTATRRRFSDLTMRPLWGAACEALTTVVAVPGGSRLWYDDRDVMFLQADLQDAAAVRKDDASTIMSLINAGYKPDAIIEAVTSGDFSTLTGQHTGLTSVQLQPPQTEPDAALTGGAQPAPEPIPAPSNGTKPGIPAGV